MLLVLQLSPSEELGGERCAQFLQKKKNLTALCRLGSFPGAFLANAHLYIARLWFSICPFVCREHRPRSADVQDWRLGIARKASSMAALHLQDFLLLFVLLCFSFPFLQVSKTESPVSCSYVHRLLGQVCWLPALSWPL